MSEMHKIKAAVVGYGNIGRYAVEALEAAADFELVGVVRRDPSQVPLELRPYPVVRSIEELGAVDVALLCTPTRLVEQTALGILARGIRTVDSFDIHTDILSLRRTLGEAARQHGTVSVIASGWDPGSDSVVRTLMEAIVPRGITYTNFGPGMSMGHTVAVKAIAGVKRALSMTIPTSPDGTDPRSGRTSLDASEPWVLYATGDPRDRPPPRGARAVDREALLAG